MVVFLLPECASLSFDVNIVQLCTSSTFASANIPMTYITKKPLWQVTQLLQTWSVQDFTLATPLKPYLLNSSAVTGQVKAM